MKKRNLLTLILMCLFILPIPSFAAEDTVCARVKIEIRQEMTLERQAFDAHMRVNNGLSHITLENVDVDVTFSDENGNTVLASSNPGGTNALFFIRLDSMENIDNVDGGGTIQPSSSADIHWLIIPAPGASNGLTQGKLYYVGATLTYTIGGEGHTTIVSPDYIYVKPMPELTLDYFLPTDVYGDDAFTPEIEPSVPFSLGVRVKNNGHGVARSLKIDSAQPKIVENEQGLLIGFVIEGSEVNGQPATNSLLVDFGDIKPNTSGIARWIMTCSLSGRFVEFKAEYSHSDELGGELTSLLDAVNTHFLVHDVLVDLSGRDSIRDYLAKDSGVYTVYESDSVDTGVRDQSAFSGLSLEGQIGTEAHYLLSTPVTAGFMYVQLPDPFSGQKVIKEVIRSDGKRIRPENAWLSKTRIKNDPWQHFINLFDVNTTDSYRVIFNDPAAIPHAPVLQFIPDRTGVEGSQLSFIVEASDPDGTIPLLSASHLPALAKFTDEGNGEGIFDWTPAMGQAGTYEITFTASDGVLTATRRALLVINPITDTDRDDDGVSDEDEYRYGSDPFDPLSYPMLTRIYLKKGFNLISAPSNTHDIQDAYAFLRMMDNSGTKIERIDRYNNGSGRVEGAVYNQDGSIGGDNFPMIAGEGIIVSALEDMEIEVYQNSCPRLDLKAGINWIGPPCLQGNSTAFSLLRAIGDVNVVSIQRFNTDTGQFETAAFQNGVPVGIDFPIRAGEGYFIYMKQGVSGFRP